MRHSFEDDKPSRLSQYFASVVLRSARGRKASPRLSATHACLPQALSFFCSCSPFFDGLKSCLEIYTNKLCTYMLTSNIFLCTKDVVSATTNKKMNQSRPPITPLAHIVLPRVLYPNETRSQTHIWCMELQLVPENVACNITTPPPTLCAGWYSFPSPRSVFLHGHVVVVLMAHASRTGYFQRGTGLRRRRSVPQGSPGLRIWCCHHGVLC